MSQKSEQIAEFIETQWEAKALFWESESYFWGFENNNLIKKEPKIPTPFPFPQDNVIPVIPMIDDL